MLPNKYGIHEKTVKKADGSYRSLPMLRIHYYLVMKARFWYVEPFEPLLFYCAGIRKVTHARSRAGSRVRTVHTYLHFQIDL